MHLSRSRASAKYPRIELCSPYSRMSGSDSKVARLIWSMACAAVCVGVCTLLMAQQSGSGSLFRQAQAEADRKSAGCIACHGTTDSPSMHSTGTVRLGCTDCHGGHPDVQPPSGAQKGAASYEQAKKQAHPKP